MTDDRYAGEDDRTYEKRKEHEAAVAAHEAKYPTPASYDPFAGMPSE